jgi:DNA-binding response OmpR family regulator
VEDDLPARRALCRILNLRQFDVHEVGTVGDAQRALGGAFDWVLLDLMLPDGNGIDVLRRIRREQLPVKVCVISGCCTELFDEARACGAEEALVKPIDTQRLLDVLSGTMPPYRGAPA